MSHLTDSEKKTLAQLTSELAALNDKLTREKRSDLFLETLDSENDEIVFNANTEGFVYLAVRLLTLANSGREGSHEHFDSATLDKCEKPLVFAFKNADWDK